MRFRLSALIAGAAVIAGCHSEPTAPDGREAASDAAQTMLHLADSLSANGGNPGEVGAYRGLASLLIGTGRLSTVTISVDGVASDYLATAQEILWGCPLEMLCTMQKDPPTRSLVAWDKNNPRRMVQLFASPGPIITFAADDTSVPSALPSLLYLDGHGGMYGGEPTSQNVSVTLSDTPCASPGDIATADTWPCREAEFSAAFDGTVTLIPLEGAYLHFGTPPSSSSTPEHHVSMSSQSVHGAHVDMVGVCEQCSDSIAPPPVTTPWRDSLSATLSATVGSDVTFTFTVKNTKPDSTAYVNFNDAQQYDIRVWDENDTLVWRWGADKGFAQPVAVGALTLAPGESATYVAHWTPASAGNYHAMAYLTSSSHGAVAFTNFSTP